MSVFEEAMTLRKGAVLAIMVITALGVGGCLGSRPTQVARFRITDVTFRKLAGVPTAASSRTEPTITGRFIIRYVSDDVTAVAFDWAYGRQDPNQPWHAAGSDPDLDGQYTFDTTFTSLNWVTIRGTATTSANQVVVDERVVNIDNAPPDVSVTPRNHSVLNTQPAEILVNVVDGGATEGTDETGTEVNVSVDGSSLSCSRTDYEDQIRLVPQGGWPDGLYEITIVPRDVTGNVGDPVVSEFIVDRSIQGKAPTVSITNPASGTTVSGTVELNYTASPDVDRVWVDYAFGQSEPLAWQEFDEDATVDGAYPLDTTLITRQNWMSVRLFVKSTSGLTAVSEPIVLDVRNP